MKICVPLYRILVADNKPLERQAIKIVVAASGLKVEIAGEAKNGSEAITLTRELEPNIVFIDIKIPRINGLTAAREIKGFLPNIDIIVFTTYDNPDYKQEAQKIGVADYLLKPVHPDEVVAALERLISIPRLKSQRIKI